MDGYVGPHFTGKFQPRFGRHAGDASILCHLFALAASRMPCDVEAWTSTASVALERRAIPPADHGGYLSQTAGSRRVSYS